MTGNRVSLDAFEGPMDLLLHLVKHHEVDICDVSIERITRDYLDFLEQAREPDLPLAGEFIVMAAHLMYVKSRELLPAQDAPLEQGPEEEGPSWDFVRQLIEYKKFKDAAGQLAVSEMERSLLYSPLPPCQPPPPAGESRLNIDPLDLLTAFQRVLARSAAKPASQRIVDERWSVPDRIADLRRTVQPGKTVRFSNLFQPDASREEYIATFLAILELMRTHEFQASQNGFLGDIELNRLDSAQPAPPEELQSPWN